MTVTEKLNGYGPLAGIKVVEMCTYVAAPATVRVLSEMGAEVLKIESFDGDIQRTQGPGFGCDLTDTEDPTIDLNNTNKNWISLNLKSEEGLAIAKKMIGEADIFMNNMRTAALEKLGLDYPTLSAEFPGLIWAQMRGYGEFGEFAHSPGYDAVCWAARGGVAGTFCEKGTSPAIPPQAFGDYNTATMMAAGILGALVNKLRTAGATKSSSTCTTPPSGAAASPCARSSSAPTTRRRVRTCRTRSTTRTKPRTTSGSTSASRSITAITTT